MKIEQHGDGAAALEKSLGNKVGYSSQDILPIHQEKFHRLIFLTWWQCSCRLQLSCFITNLRHLVEQFSWEWARRAQQKHHNINTVNGDSWILCAAELVLLVSTGEKGVWSAVTPLLVLEMIIIALLPFTIILNHRNLPCLFSLCHIFYVCLLKKE